VYTPSSKGKFAVTTNTGGKGTWKQVGTYQEHCRDWTILPDMFPAGTSHAQLECNFDMFLTFTQWEYCRYMASSPCNLQEHGDKLMCLQCSLRKTHVPAIFPLGECQEHVKITFQLCMRCSWWESSRCIVALHSECV